MSDKENSRDPKKDVSTTRRLRGRPKGSKNKPKQPIIVTKPSPDTLLSHVIEFASGVNIVESLFRFAMTHQTGLCVLSATGTVVNVTLQQEPGAIMVLHGQHNIVSLTGSFFPSGSAPPMLTTLTICLASSEGRMIGGAVVGPLVASGTVTVMVANFANAIYERLPLPIKENDKEGQSGGADNADGSGGFDGQQPRGPLNVQQVKYETFFAWGYDLGKPPY
ncbi:hypothetical protein RIF29_24209 [Crotalaria pallida]|uniref:AT-hook motif nuclear-localized protein n=1 Tax=Crotalaria pallida TaxID=3830 RepID=A0AAN9EJX8_CROPI